MAKLPDRLKNAQNIQVGGRTSGLQRSKSAPAMFLEDQNRLYDAEQRSKAFEGALPVKRIDSSLIDFSALANRISSSFQSPEFEGLKNEIMNMGGNIQPIKVRPKAGRFEVVFGHRRTAACKELGLPVLAMIEELSDRDLWLQMHEENEGRENLSAYEQAKHYQNAIREGFYKNWTILADDLGKVKSALSRYKALADLPSEVINCFVDPTQIKLKDAENLSKRRAQNPVEFDQKVARIKNKQLPYGEVISALLPKEVVNKFTQVNLFYGTIKETHQVIIIEINKSKLSTDSLKRLKKELLELNDGNDLS